MVALLREEAPPLSDTGRPVSAGARGDPGPLPGEARRRAIQSARDLAFSLRVLDRSGNRAEWEHTPSRPGSSGSGLAAPPAEASVAVLPFRNMSPDPDAEYFSDGITEEIISVLTHVASLRVAARTSCFAFKGKDTDVRIIGQELGVRTVLEGSVRRPAADSASTRRH